MAEGALRSINDYFEKRLRAVPEIAAYIDELVARASGAAG